MISAVIAFSLFAATLQQPLQRLETSRLRPVESATLAPAQGATKDARSYVAGNYFLNLAGLKTGFVKSVEGGGIFAEVIQEPTGPSYYVKKHIGTPKYENFTLQLGF